jgi:dTDP-glucose 4,6-dehydratase
VRVLVTGGAGFIGSNFVRRVLDGSLNEISRVTVVDKLTYAGNMANLQMLDERSFEFIHGDICDPSLINRITKSIDAIVNFAAESHVDRSIAGAEDFVRTNILGTQTLLDAALRNDVKTFLQISTDEVYGTIMEGSWNENFPLQPNSPYSASKASADLIALAYHRTHKLDVRITRCSNNYGPYQNPEKVIPLFITNLIQGKKIPIYGNGKNIRDWLHVDDHCSGIFLTLRKGAPGEIYNLGGGKELTNLDLGRLLLMRFGRDESWIDWVPDRKGHDFRYCVDYTKSLQSLGYRPTYDFNSAIDEVIAWYKANEEWWRGRKVSN